jgi:hypothetical protein
MVFCKIYILISNRYMFGTIIRQIPPHPTLYMYGHNVPYSKKYPMVPNTKCAALIEVHKVYEENMI